ncbi:MAG: rhodanese-like domain-containing protein [Bacteroidota bacterium]
MKTKSVFFYSIIALVFSACSNAQNSKEPWAENQLMQPSELAKILNDSASTKPILFSVFSGGIKNSIDLGPASEKEGIENLKKQLSKLPKDTNIVIYCGCCPFKDCPNIRPAFKLLNEMKFTNHKLLNLSHNFKVDWIDKGYPMNE